MLYPVYKEALFSEKEWEKLHEFPLCYKLPKFPSGKWLPFSFCEAYLLLILEDWERKLFKMAAQNVEKLLILNKHKRWFHSSLAKLPLVRMSASWFLVSTYLIWIFGSKLVLSNNQSRGTLWVLDTRLIVGLRPLIIILITASLSSKMYTTEIHLEKNVCWWVCDPLHLTDKQLVF